MPDYDYYSPENVRVATDGLRESSAKWKTLSQRMAEVSTVAGQQTLQQSAFAIIVDGPISGNTTLSLHHAYEQEFKKLTALYGEAEGQFQAMGKALERNAEWYEDADETSAQSFDGIAQTDWPH